MNLPEQIADFKVLPLLYKKSAWHALYLREHVSRPSKGGEEKATFPNGRTLFVVNIPPDATERELSLFFNPCGTVERVVIDRDSWTSDAYAALEDSEGEEDEEGATLEEEAAEAGSNNPTHTRKTKKPSKKKQKTRGPPPQVILLPQPELPLRTFRHTGSSSHIIFTDSSSLSRALSLRASSSKPRTWPPTAATTAPSGLAHYTAIYKAQRPSLPDVKAHADSFLEVYEYNKALLKQKSEYRKGEAVVDEDGFTLVTRGGAYGTTLGGGVGVATKRFMKDIEEGQEVVSENRKKKKPKKHEKDGFYKFQLHEQKRKELVDLKAEFEKDKEKVARLKESRRFKPY